MGDVVIFAPNGDELRLTHDDFLSRGADDPRYEGLGRVIYLSKETRNRLGAPMRIGVVHATDVAAEEAAYGGHNAYVDDDLRLAQLPTYTAENRGTDDVIVLPHDIMIRIVHEAGEGTINGEFTQQRIELEAGKGNHKEA